MAVSSVNIQIEQGANFSSTFDVKKSDQSPLDLTGFSFNAKMRKHAASAGAIGFAVTYGATPANGQVTLSMTNTQTGIITSGRYEYDVLITNLLSGVKTKIFTGQVLVNPTSSM
tara:strand:+ start:1408 stop:1749 length:342 start_codon:yes stop_codon:yes gene_type:complete